MNSFAVIWQRWRVYSSRTCGLDFRFDFPAGCDTKARYFQFDALAQLERSRFFEGDFHAQNACVGRTASVERLEVLFRYGVGNFFHHSSPASAGVALASYLHG